MSIVPTSSGDPYTEGWTSAVQLARAIEAGYSLPSQDQTQIILGVDEVYHCGVLVHLARFHGLDGVAYNTMDFISLGSWKTVLASGAASFAFNGWQRRKAEREAASKWRTYGNVPLHLTSGRLMLAYEGQMDSFFLRGDLAAFDVDWGSYRMVVQPHSQPPMVMEGPAVPYLAVAMNVLIWGRPPQLPTSG